MITKGVASYFQIYFYIILLYLLNILIRPTIAQKNDNALVSIIFHPGLLDMHCDNLIGYEIQGDELPLFARATP